MASDSESKTGSYIEEEPEKFNWTEFHLFVSDTENDVKVNTYTDYTKKSYKSFEAFKEAIKSHTTGPKPKPIVLAYTGKDTMTVLHNIHVLEGGEVVGIRGTRLYSPYKEIGVDSLVRTMNVTKKNADSSDGIPSVTDFEIDYGSRKTEAHRNSAEKGRSKISRNDHHSYSSTHWLSRSWEETQQ